MDRMGRSGRVLVIRCAITSQTATGEAEPQDGPSSHRRLAYLRADPLSDPVDIRVTGAAVTECLDDEHGLVRGTDAVRDQRATIGSRYKDMNRERLLVLIHARRVAKRCRAFGDRCATGGKAQLLCRKAIDTVAKAELRCSQRRKRRQQHRTRQSKLQRLSPRRS